MATPYRKALLAAMGLLLSACAPKPAKQLDATSSVRLLEIGGDGKGVTQSFATSGATILIAYHLTRSSGQSITFFAQRDVGGGEFQPAASVSVPGAEPDGTTRLSLIPGTYRLRVDSDVPWSATISEPRP